MNFTAIVPVKRFAVAKTRLSPLFDAGERAAFAAAMLDDVLGILGGVDTLDDIVVATGDPDAASIARSHGADVIDDARSDLNAAIASAHRAVPAGSGVLVVPSDIPAVTVREITELLDAATAYGVALARAARDGGTNLLAWRGDVAMKPAFGENSLRVHIRTARELGVQPAVLNLAGASLDIDWPADVEALTRRACGLRTAVFLREHARILELAGVS